MPLVENSGYKAPLFMRNGHLLSVYPSLFRRITSDFYRRERIDTPDDDFLDLDWSETGSDRLAIISHGLEGDSHRPYVVGMVQAVNRNGWDALAWNFRSCSGEINRQLRFYHSGSVDDLDLVIRHSSATKRYRQIALIGFSMGGNQILVYLGKHARELDRRIVRAVVFSVPCDLKGSAAQLAKYRNTIYMKRFLRLLHNKVRAKMEIMPDRINDEYYHLLKNFKDYDDRYTAPIHGFESAEEYWEKCSSRPYIPHIKIPTLIVNALDDPFLDTACYPVEEASKSGYVCLETPAWGGHVGFVSFNAGKSYWSERRAVAFLNDAM